MNTESSPTTFAPVESQASLPSRDYPVEPVRSQWVVDLTSHRVVRREVAGKARAARGGSGTS